MDDRYKKLDDVVERVRYKKELEMTTLRDLQRSYVEVMRSESKDITAKGDLTASTYDEKISRLTSELDRYKALDSLTDVELSQMSFVPSAKEMPRSTTETGYWARLFPEKAKWESVQKLAEDYVALGKLAECEKKSEQRAVLDKIMILTRPYLESIAYAVQRKPQAIVRNYVTLERGQDIDDLVQDASLAIASKMDQYDPARSRFTTWAKMMGLSAMVQGALPFDNPVGISRGQYTKAKKVLRESKGKPCLSAERVVDIVTQKHQDLFEEIIDDESTDESVYVFEEVFADKKPTTEQLYAQAQEQKMVRDTVERVLTEREKEVITIFFGLGYASGSSEEVAQEMGVDKLRVRQLEFKVLRKLRMPDGLPSVLRGWSMEVI